MGSRAEFLCIVEDAGLQVFWHEVDALKAKSHVATFMSETSKR